MVLEGIVDREIRDRVAGLLAHQRDAPIRLRIVCPCIRDVLLPDGKTMSQHLRQLIAWKDARVTVVVDPRSMAEDDDQSFLQKLEETGVKVHCKRDLHAKAILLESKREHGLVVSSANLTETGLGRQQEMGIYILNEHRDVFQKLDSYVTGLLRQA